MPSVCREGSRVFARLKSILANDKAFFVFVNVAVNLLFLLRSYVSMRVLDYADLGLVALLQTLVLLVGALQLGVINGGYRLLCSEGPAGGRQVNDFVYTFTLCLAAAAFVLGAVTIPFARGADYVGVTFLGILAGIMTILRNWMTNQMIAKTMLRDLNRINLASAAASMLALAFAGLHPLLSCLASVVLQPIAFVTHGLLTKRSLRPARFGWSNALLGRTLAAGFVVFLTGMFLLANNQIERWAVVSYLGVEGLGHFYLALLFLNLYALVPSSFDAIFLPRLVQAHAGGRHAGMQADLRRFFLATLCYSLVSVLVVLFLARPVIGILLPNYLPDLRYVYLVLPGVALFGLTAPFAITFNVLIQYRYYFQAYGLGTLATLAILGGYVYAMGTIDLATVSTVKSGVYVLMGVIILLGYVRICARHAEFRFQPFRLRSVARA